MSDHTYMMQCLNQNIGYNQPNNLGYFLGTGMDKSVIPVGIATGISELHNAPKPHDSTTIYDLSGRVVSHPKAGIYVKNGKKFVVK